MAQAAEAQAAVAEADARSKRKRAKDARAYAAELRREAWVQMHRASLAQWTKAERWHEVNVEAVLAARAAVRVLTPSELETLLEESQREGNLRWRLRRAKAQAKVRAVLDGASPGTSCRKAGLTSF
jgi:hypothetical protein